jgi:D-alanyl-D-alanine carboxypeptidase/D-alanyl-D-alanine-endopeptidase (penicillin-binding protein 4)
MRTTLLASLCTAVLLGSLGSATCRAAETAAGSSSLARALRAPALKDAQVSALVVRARDGGAVFERQPDSALIPASNQKILTAVAALSYFGPTHRFPTRIESSPALAESGAVETLCVIGTGDPLLTSEQWWRLSADLRVRGLRRVRGDILLDARAFDRVSHHPSWGKVTSRAYFGPVSALSANYGAFEVWVSSESGVGAPPAVRIDPPLSYFELANRAEVGSGSSKLRVDRARTATGERITVAGRLSARAGSRRFARSVSDPVAYAGAVFLEHLRGQGIVVDGEAREAAADCNAPLYEFEGLPMATAVRRFLKWSNNAIGETLVKAMGAAAEGVPGTWEKGVRTARRELAERGIPIESARWIDGSGLSRQNRVSSRTLVTALRAARESFQWGPEFMAGLPVGGADGTLKDRAKDVGTALRAKTGLLNGVSGLSGYVDARNGELLIFSVLVNRSGGDANAVMRALDGFALALHRLPGD